MATYEIIGKDLSGAGPLSRKGNAGDILNTSAVISSGGQTFTPTALAGAITLAAGYVYAGSTAGGAFTATLPSAPTAGTQILIYDADRTFGTNTLTIAAGAGDTVASAATFAASNVGAQYRLLYDATANDWSMGLSTDTVGGASSTIWASSGTNPENFRPNNTDFAARVQVVGSGLTAASEAGWSPGTGTTNNYVMALRKDPIIAAEAFLSFINENALGEGVTGRTNIIFQSVTSNLTSGKIGVEHDTTADQMLFFINNKESSNRGLRLSTDAGSPATSTEGRLSINSGSGEVFIDTEPFLPAAGHVGDFVFWNGTAWTTRGIAGGTVPSANREVLFWDQGNTRWNVDAGPFKIQGSTTALSGGNVEFEDWNGATGVRRRLFLNQDSTIFNDEPGACGLACNQYVEHPRATSSEITPVTMLLISTTKMVTIMPYMALSVCAVRAVVLTGHSSLDEEQARLMDSEQVLVSIL